MKGGPSSDALALRPTEGASQSQACTAAARWLAHHVDEVVALVMQRLRDDVPEYRAYYERAHRRDQVSANVTEIVGYFVGVLAQSRRLNEREQALAEAVGTERAFERFPLRSIQEAIHVAVAAGSEFLDRHLASEAGLGVRIDGALAVARVIRDFEHDLQRAIEAGYHNAEVSRVGEETVTRDLALRRLLEGTGTGHPDPTGVLSDLDPDERFCLMLVLDHGRPAAELGRRARALLQRVGGRCEGPVGFHVPRPHAAVLAWRGGDTEALLSHLDDLAREHDVHVLVDEVGGVAALAHTYRMARDLAALDFSAAPRVFVASDVWHLAVVPTAPTIFKLELVRRTFASLMTGEVSQPAVFRETLLALYRSVGVSFEEAAEALGRDRKTIGRRLEELRARTGLHHRRDRFRLELAARAWADVADLLAPPGDQWWSRGGVRSGFGRRAEDHAS